MLEPTPAVTRAMDIARQWACSQQSAQILPAHLLQGLLHDHEGRPWQLLMQTGFDPQLIRSTLPASTEGSGQEEPRAGKALRKIMIRAEELAHCFAAEGSIGSEHVLFALVETDADLRQQLEAGGLHFERLEAAVGAAQG